MYFIIHLETDAHHPSHDPVIAPDQDILQIRLRHPPPLSQRVPVEVEQLQTLDPEHETCPVEAVNQLQLNPQILLGQVIQHSKRD